MPAFTCHLFVCCNRREAGHPRGCCDPEGGETLKNAFKAELKKHGLGAEFRANGAGCLDQCEYGPCAVVYPQGVWYGKLTPADVPRIVAETVVGGRIVEGLRIPDACLNTKGRVAWKVPPEKSGD